MVTVALTLLVIVHLIVQTYAHVGVVKPVATAETKSNASKANPDPTSVPKNKSAQTPAAQGPASSMPESLSKVAKAFYERHASLLTPGVSKSDFKVQRHLSSGEDGSVDEVKRIKDGKTFAMKKMVLPAKEKFSEFAEQVDIQVTATRDKRTHINNVIAVFLDENSLCMVLEMMKGDVDELILYADQPVNLTEMEFCHMAKGMMEDLAYLEEKGISHRDLDTCNLFVNKNNEIVIGDFQRATKQREFSCKYHAWSSYGPPEWKKERTDIKCTIKVDVWAIGVFLRKIKTKITDASEAFNNMLSSNVIFSEEPSQRPSFSKILASPLFQQC